MEFTTGLMSLDTALNEMLSRVTPLTAQETLPLVQCFGRILASDVVSPLDVPGFDNSAMDGYAVRLADIASGQPLPVAGKSFAGQPYHGEWPAGTCIRIMTGAPVPEGCEAVVMQEQTEQTDNGVRFTVEVRSGQNIRRRGEDISAGAVVFPAGTRLTTAELPVIASLGIAEVPVIRKVRVALFSTGDELQLPGQPLGDGQIYDTNRLAVHLMLEQLGCEVINLGIIPDDPEKLRAAFIEADNAADVVISSGGVSVGEADYTKTILEELGEIAFWKLAIKPGKPFAFGKLSNSWFCGLPGNPVSAALTFYQLVQPLLAAIPLTAYYLGIIPPVTNIAPWTMPAGLGAFFNTNGSVAAFLLAIFNLGIATLLYMPFVAIANKAATIIDEEESEEDIALSLKF